MVLREPGCILLLAVTAFPWVLSSCQGNPFARVPDPSIVYVAFGDSTTKGPSERNYVDYLPDLLGQGPEAFANEGKGGESSGEGLDRLRSLVSRQFFPNAKVLFYWEGAKDLIEFMRKIDPFLGQSPDSAAFPFSPQLNQKLDEIQANVEEAIRIGRQAGLRVFVATYFYLPPGSLDCDSLLFGVLLPAQAANANGYVTRLNERIRQAAVNQGATVVDVATRDATLRRSPDNYVNCNHLSAQGNEIVARLFQEVIQGVPGN